MELPVNRLKDSININEQFVDIDPGIFWVIYCFEISEEEEEYFLWNKVKERFQHDFIS